jgi:hypothetical protein
MTRILVLILASDTNYIYLEFQKLWRQYMNKYPNIDCYFYKAMPDIAEEAVLVSDDTLHVKCAESLETCYEKMLKAFEFFKPKFNQYDFIFRTNLSSFVYFDRYLELVKDWPTSNFCAAMVKQIDNGMPFPEGCGFTITPDLIVRLLEKPPTLLIQDDVTLGMALYEWGITIHPVDRYDILIYNQYASLKDDLKFLENQFHFRIKNIEGLRCVDPEVMKILIGHYY